MKMTCMRHGQFVCSQQRACDRQELAAGREGKRQAEKDNSTTSRMWDKAHTHMCVFDTQKQVQNQPPPPSSPKDKNATRHVAVAPFDPGAGQIDSYGLN